MCFFFQWLDIPSGPSPPHCRGFTITLRHTILGRTPLDEWSARRRNLYLTTHNTHKIQTSVPPVGFEPAILASGRPQTHVLDRAATGIGGYLCRQWIISLLSYLITSMFSAQDIRLTFVYLQQCLTETRRCQTTVSRSCNVSCGLCASISETHVFVSCGFTKQRGVITSTSAATKPFLHQWQYGNVKWFHFMVCRAVTRVDYRIRTLQRNLLPPSSG
jgi:hypothetical protein